ncbi:MAG: tripartite tricarboxylate transporter substrate-binding protein [Thermodesulfobacteriota bacterium]|nr:tripartite tricarboxylate transporter substrate-binding protein [Thermodesulfobacteriota bacterium]
MKIRIIGPRGIPKPIVVKIHDAFKKSVEDSDFQATMEKIDMSLLYLNADDYDNFFRQDSEQIERI